MSKKAIKIAVLGVALTLVASSFANSTEADELAELRALMAKRGDKGIEVIRRTFPVEYGEAEKKIARQYASTHDENAALLSLGAFGAQIGAKYFYQIAQAPNLDLEAIANARLAQYKMLEKFDPVACRELGETGTIDKDREVSLLHVKGDPNANPGYYLFLALEHAREHPVSREPLTEEDRVAIARQYLKQGGSIEFLKAEQNGTLASTFSDEQRCENLILFDAAVKSMPIEVASRFWARVYSGFARER